MKITLLGTGDAVGGGLEADGEEGRDDREDRVAEEAVALDHGPGSGRSLATSAMVSGALPSARLFTSR